MQYQTIQVVRLQIAQGLRKRLGYLLGQAGGRIVGQPLRILTIQRCKLGLKKDVLTAESRLQRPSHTVAHTRFMVVFGLACGVKPTEAQRESLLDQTGRLLLFPGGAIHDLGDTNTGVGHPMAIGVLCMHRHSSVLRGLDAKLKAAKARVAISAFFVEQPS
jgi:hypothetical protein